MVVLTSVQNAAVFELSNDFYKGPERSKSGFPNGNHPIWRDEILRALFEISRRRTCARGVTGRRDNGNRFVTPNAAVARC